MHVLMVTDAYPPMRTSCAVQMYDLSQAFIEEGHQVTVITPVSSLNDRIHIGIDDGVRLVRVKAFKTKDINYVCRALAEFVNPFLIWHNLRKRPEIINTQFNGIIWYSPTIFWGPLIKRLKKQFNVKTYLILRDIFPDWALDLGIIKEGLVYKFLKLVENFQYQQADIIGVQSPNNVNYFKERNQGLKAHIEVLWNWMGQIKETECSIDLSKTILSGRKIYVYTGNMGIAQSVDRLINIARYFKDQRDIGFVFVGRGSEVERLKGLVIEFGLTNTIFFDEIPFTEIPALLKQCHGGLVSLDPRHITHNIPGKVLTYLMGNIPIFGFVNEGNDLIQLSIDYEIGYITHNDDLNAFCSKFLDFQKFVDEKKFIKEGPGSAVKLFSNRNAAFKISTYFVS